MPEASGGEGHGEDLGRKKPGPPPRDVRMAASKLWAERRQVFDGRVGGRRTNQKDLFF